MKLEWLEAVNAVAMLSSFSEAAEAIPCAQSSVSRHVKHVEDELGVSIFSRSSNSNKVTLTPEGEQILPLIQKLLANYNELQQFSRHRGDQRRQSLRLGLNERMYSSACKGNLISALYMAYPEIRLTIKELAPDVNMEALYSNRVDALLLPRAVPVAAGPERWLEDDFIQCEFVGQQKLAIAYGADYVPADRQSITLPELQNQTFIFHTDIVKAYEPNSVEHNRGDHFVKACLDSGFEPKIKLVDQNLADIKQALTIQGRGIFPSTIPSGLREYPGICYISVSDAPFLTQYYLAFLKQNRNPAIPKLTKILKECF